MVQAPPAIELAAHGAELLDNSGPEDWACQIDLGELDLADCTACVLGQLYADEVDIAEEGYFNDGYDVGRTRLNLSTIQEAAEYGFDLLPGYERPLGYELSYAALDEAWTEIIARRQKEKRCK